MNKCLRSTIVANAALLCELRKRPPVPANKLGSKGRQTQDSDGYFWERYDELAFPGGLRSGLERLAAGDLQAIEAALLYLELRPFHYRAQYNRNHFTKLLKRQKLPVKLGKRFASTREKLRAWRAATRGNGKWLYPDFP